MSDTVVAFRTILSGIVMMSRGWAEQAALRGVLAFPCKRNHGHSMQIHRLGQGDLDTVVNAGHLFDHSPTRPWTEDFLSRAGHHLLLADVGGLPAGFVTGVEIAHPDKGVEMLLYELGVDDAYRRRGIGRALVEALKTLARRVGCAGMWVPVEQGNDVATAFYRATGAHEPEPGATLLWDLR